MKKIPGGLVTEPSLVPHITDLHRRFKCVLSHDFRAERPTLPGGRPAARVQCSYTFDLFHPGARKRI